MTRPDVQAIRSYTKVSKLTVHQLLDYIERLEAVIDAVRDLDIHVLRVALAQLDEKNSVKAVPVELIGGELTPVAYPEIGQSA